MKKIKMKKIVILSLCLLAFGVYFGIKSHTENKNTAAAGCLYRRRLALQPAFNHIFHSGNLFICR